MNLYRSCSHNCAYCDGRAETYGVEGEFGTDVFVKINAADLLAKELDPARKRKPMPKSFMLLGGGVCDAYQPAEAKYLLTRRALELMEKYGYPVHILTKSTLVERDIDILRRIHERSRVIVSFSISSADDGISGIFEPHAPGPMERLRALENLKKLGFPAGIFLMPVIPFVTDTPDLLEAAVCRAAGAGADFIIFGGMTLKEGRQKDCFMRVLNEHYPDLLSRYGMLYSKNDRWGGAHPEYYQSLSALVGAIARRHRIPLRIPPHIYREFISTTDRVIVILEHLDYLMKLDHQKSPYGFAAYSISMLNVPVESLSRDQLLRVRGVGPAVEGIIREVLDSGRCGYYEKLLYGG